MTTAALTAGLERIPDQLGYLVISEDGVLASAGELENDEHTAGVMMQMVRTASRFKLPGSADPPFKRMSGAALGDSGKETLPLTGRNLEQNQNQSQALVFCLDRLGRDMILEDFVYTVTVSGHKVFVVKRQNNQREPINV